MQQITWLPESKKEKKQRDMMERLDRLQREFMENRTKIYQEKLVQIEQEIHQISNNVHPEYEEARKLLLMERDQQILKAELFRSYQLEFIDSLYETEKESFLVEYQKEKQGLKDKLIASLEEKKIKLKQDCDAFELQNDFDTKKSIGTRKAARLALQVQNERNKRRRQDKTPQLPLLLKDYEIMEDITIVRKVNHSRKYKVK